nr:hypothetical protein [Tanacetum cinerariifolium]
MLSYSIRTIDPNSSLGKICLGEDVVVIPSDKVKGLRDWNSPEYQDTAVSKGKKVVNTLKAYDGEVYLEFDENLISNEYAVKLCLDYEVKKGKKLVKKELIVALKGELYFLKFIINPEEDNSEPGIILGRSFLRLVHGIIDFELPPFICKIKKSNHNKKRTMENLNLFYQDIRPSLSDGVHLTQEEAEKEALAVGISQKFALLEEKRHMIKTMAYNDKYKKILDEIWKDKVELDGKTVKEEEDAVKRIKREALKEKDDPDAFIFPIRLEGKVNENALTDAGLDINTMPYRIYETLGREEMKKIDKGITMINHTQAEAMGKLSNVLCQVGVTTIITKFLILDITIDRDAPIVVGRGFLYTMGSIHNTPDRLFSTFNGVCHQTFRAVRFDVLRTTVSDSDDEEEYVIKRNRFGAPIYGLKPAQYLNCTNLEDRSSSIQTVTNPFRKISVWKKAEHSTKKSDRHDPNTQDNTKQWKRCCFHKFTTSSYYGKDVAEILSLEIDDMLRNRLHEAVSDEEIFTFVTWIRAFNINEPIYAELCHEFYSTYEFDEVCAGDELQSKKIIRFRLGGQAHNLTLLEFARRLGLYQVTELEEEGFNVYFEGDEEIFTSVVWIIAFDINKSIYAELFHEFFSTYEFDEVCVGDELQSKKIIRFRLGGRAHNLILLEFARRLGLYQVTRLEEERFNVYFKGGLRSDDHFNAQDYWLSISREEHLCLSRSHTSTIRNPILSLGNCEMDEKERRGNSERELNLLWSVYIKAYWEVKGVDIGSEDPKPRVPRVGIPIPPRASMQDLYDMMGMMEIHQEAIEHMKYRQSYYWDTYHGGFEHMAGVYSVSLQGAYNPPGYAQS